MARHCCDRSRAPSDNIVFTYQGDGDLLVRRKWSMPQPVVKISQSFFINSTIRHDGGQMAPTTSGPGDRRPTAECRNSHVRPRLNCS